MMEELIKKYINEDTIKLALKQNSKTFANVPKAEFDLLLTQIAVRQRQQHKFPTLASNYCFVFASAMAAEQASSELTAHYKANIAAGGRAALDLTGGLGIDSIYFAKHFGALHYCEPAANLCQSFAKNCDILGLKNASLYNISAEEYLHKAMQQQQHFDMLYVDPSRRPNNGKTFLMEDSAPNVVNLQANFAKVADKAIIKLSPMFDIHKALRQIDKVAQVHIISVDNDCKELLLVCDYKNNTDNIKFVAANILMHPKGLLACQAGIADYIKTVQQIDITLGRSNAAEQLTSSAGIEFGAVEQYIYEPNASLMKLGCWAHLCKQYDLKKIHPLSHIGTKEVLVNRPQDFPGTVYEVIDVVAFSRRQVRSVIRTNQANVKCRNFPCTAAAVKQRLQLVDGGGYYLFATTAAAGKPIIIISRKVQC